MSRFLFYTLLLLPFSFFAQTKNTCEALLNKANDIYYSKPDSSYNLSLQAEKLLKQDPDNLLLAKALSYQGRYLLLKSDLEASNVKLNEALSIYRSENNNKGIAYLLTLKSNLQKRLGNIDEAIRMQEDAVRFYQKTNTMKGLLSSLMNLSLDYIHTKQFEKADSTLNEIEKNKDSLSVSDSYFFHQNKGLYFLSTDKPKEAFEEFLIAYKIAVENKMIDSQATILKEMGAAKIQTKEYLKAEEYLRKSEQISLKNDLNHELVETYEEIILLHKELNDFKEAFRVLELQNKLKEKILNIEKLNRITFLENKISLSEKEKEIESQKNKSRMLIYIVIGIALILLLTIYLFIRTSSLKNKIADQNEKLEEQNAIVELQKNIAEAKQKEIVDSITYAKRIQESLLPTEKYIDKVLRSRAR